MASTGTPPNAAASCGSIPSTTTLSTSRSSSVAGRHRTIPSRGAHHRSSRSAPGRGEVCRRAPAGHVGQPLPCRLDHLQGGVERQAGDRSDGGRIVPDLMARPLQPGQVGQEGRQLGIGALLQQCRQAGRIIPGGAPLPEGRRHQPPAGRVDALPGRAAHARPPPKRAPLTSASRSRSRTTTSGSGR